MPKGPQGQKRPADTVSAAVMVGRIATGEFKDAVSEPRGSAGGKARARALSPEERKKIAKAAAEAKWSVL